MFKKIISLPETKYLGLGIMMPWEDNLEIQFGFWKEGFESGKIDELKTICGCENVVGIFGYHCDMEKRTFSYHIACENKSNTLCSEFEELRLVGLNCAHFESDCSGVEERYTIYDTLCKEIWGQWLPNSDYISLIESETFGCMEGYALLEKYTPENPTGGTYHLDMLLPIDNKLL